MPTILGEATILLIDWLRKGASVVAGVAVAILALEAGLRVFASREDIPKPRILADSLDTPAVARRQMDEGVAVAHFSLAGARLTGNPPARAGKTVVILGDSYVMAREVPDPETMGGQLEAVARANRFPLDVRQYGWWAATPAQYIAVAPSVRKRWPSAKVIVALSGNDLDMRSLTSLPTLRVDRSGNPVVIGPPADTLTNPPLPSTLWMLWQHRWSVLRRHAPSWARGKPAQPAPVPAPASKPALPYPDSLEFAALPGAVVRGLAEAYGDQLSIVFMADVGISGGELATIDETRLLAACDSLKIKCISTRAGMVASRNSGEVAQGLSTREIGGGHLNRAGHAVVANAMWQLLKSR